MCIKNLRNIHTLSLHVYTFILKRSLEMWTKHFILVFIAVLFIWQDFENKLNVRQ